MYGRTLHELLAGAAVLGEQSEGGAANTAGRITAYVLIAAVLFFGIRGIYRSWVRNKAGIGSNDTSGEPKL